jgi:hypothetical protein
MIIANRKIVAFAVAATAALAAGSVSAEEGGTMDLMPDKQIAAAMSDQELSKQRGGFMGIAFSANFMATVENLSGNVTGTGSSSTTPTQGVTNTTQPINYSFEGNSVQLSTYVGNLGNLNGVFAINTINGFGNVVNSHLTLNIALVTLGTGSQIPSMQSLFGSR